MDLDKLRTIGAPRRVGTSAQTVAREKGSTTITTEHWDGRKDATVRPDVVRYGARIHKTGKKRGQVAEVREMTPKERKERHGDE
jgi:hypothetical protein